MEAAKTYINDFHVELYKSSSCNNIYDIFLFGIKVFIDDITFREIIKKYPILISAYEQYSAREEYNYNYFHYSLYYFQCYHYITHTKNYYEIVGKELRKEKIKKLMKK